MTKPQRFVVRMALFVVVVGVLVAILHQPLLHAFLSNPPLNSLILAVLLLGVILIFRQVLRLRPEVRWVGLWQQGDLSWVGREPALLGPLARMISTRRGQVLLSAIATRSVLDGISARLDEQREIARYMIGLLIFLGLLGTFWGLLNTIQSVGGVIAGLSVGGGDIAATFANLQRGLEAPLAGMGTAFSSSLFGLAGSLVLGFLELQVGQAQNRFYTDLEDVLSSHSRLPSGSGISSEFGDQPVPAYLQALLETTAENLNQLQRTIAQAEDGRRGANQSLMALTEQIHLLADHMRAEQIVLTRLAEGQADMRPLLARLGETAVAGSEIDEASRQHLRNIDIYLSRLVDDIGIGRNQIITELRSEIKFLARTIVAISEEPMPDR